MLTTLHEEHAISIAHGYAKISRTPMAAAVHANVGLMHATMAIYNAWCDRVPMLILGATGPLDASKRRPWIDWIHTAQDQGALIRQYVKFDDQPHSAEAATQSLVQAYVASARKPCAPSYVCLDLTLQEDEVQQEAVRMPETERYVSAAREAPGPSAEDVERVVEALKGAKKPVFLLGRMGAGKTEEWEERVKLVKRFDARVVTDIKQTAPFPYPHRCQPTGTSIFMSAASQELVREADLILSFDWVDLAGDLKAAGTPEPQAKVVHVSLDSALHNGWSKDHFALPPADIAIHADVDKTMTAILKASESVSSQQSSWPEPAPPHAPKLSTSSTIFMPDLASALYKAIASTEMCLVRVPLGWPGTCLQTTHPLAFMGLDGGAGIGSGPGQLVGTSLALQEIQSPLLPVAVIGDGEYLMASSAFWTAARYRLPLLCIVANNGSYYNDEVHQERVAKSRGREVENKWIGMRLDDPQPDLQKIAEGHGCSSVRGEQVKNREDLESALRDAAAEARKGKSVVLDVRVLPEGYAEGMSEKK